MTTKITYKSALTAVIEGRKPTDAEMEKLIALRASIEKKSGADRKPNATQIANEGLKGAIYDYMVGQPTRLFTVTEVIKEVAAVNGMSNQKVSALLRGMVEDGTATKTQDKRKSYFQAVEDAPTAYGETAEG